MPNFEVTSPEGKKFIVTAPDGASQDDVLSYAQSQFKQNAAPVSEAAPTSPTDLIKGVGNYYKNVGMGAVKGASNIGSTLLSPIDRLTGTTDRRQQIGEFFQQNADPQSLAFKGGELGAEVAGTAGIGGALAKGVRAIPLVGQAVPKLATALESGGFNIGTPAASVLGKVGDMATRVAGGAIVGGATAGAIDPEQAKTGAVIGGVLPPAVKVAGMVGSGLKSAADHILGAMTGTSAETVKSAFLSGQAGDRSFLENMRGNVPFDDVVASAKQGLSNMRAERAAQYRSGMVNIKGDKTVLDMTPIVDSVKNIQSAGNFKGKVINEKAAGTVEELANKVNDWAGSAPAEFHTPEGLDALKQAIGDIRDSTQFGTNARRAADSVYNAIKNQIQQQAPTYAKVMKDYSEASQTLSEVEKALSLGEKTSKDTAIRKLQSLMRNNAQTNYGNRLGLAKTLEQKGGVDITPAAAGQAMNSILPRGMIGAIEKVGMAGTPLAALASPPVALGMLATAPFTSPRLMGEAMYGAGRLSGGLLGGLSSLTGGALPGGAQGQIANSVMESPLLRAALYRLNGANP